MCRYNMNLITFLIHFRHVSSGTQSYLLKTNLWNISTFSDSTHKNSQSRDTFHIPDTGKWTPAPAASPYVQDNTLASAPTCNWLVHFQDPNKRWQKYSCFPALFVILHVSYVLYSIIQMIGSIWFLFVTCVLRYYLFNKNDRALLCQLTYIHEHT